MLKVQAVVIHYGDTNLLQNCLFALGKAGIGKVVIVDNSQNLPSLESQGQIDVSVIRPVVNLGFAAGVNEAAGSITSRYFLVLNPDTVMNRNALEELTRIMDAEPGTWVAGPILKDEAGKIQSSGFRTPSPASFFRQAFRIRKGYSQPYRALARGKSPYDAGWILGACLLVRSDRFREMGGMDERFFLYGEDKDFCIRSARRGGGVRMAPAAVVNHAGNSSDLSEAAKITHFFESQIQYIRKHFKGTGKIVATLGLFIGASGRALINLHKPERRSVYSRGARRCLF